MTGDQQLVNIYSLDGGRPYRGAWTHKNMDAALEAANDPSASRYKYIKTVPLSEWERESGENRREPSV